MKPFTIRLMTLRLLLIGCVFGFGFAAGAAEGGRATEDKQVEKMPTNDREFLAQAISGQIGDIKCAELAQSKSTNPKIRDFAKQVTDDHSMIRDAFLDKAKEMKVAVVAGTEKEHRDRYDRLTRLEGSEFDQAFLSEIIKSHEKGEKMYERWAERADDAGLRALAAQAHKMDRHHLEKARELNKSF